MFKIGDEIIMKDNDYRWTRVGSIGKIIKKGYSCGVWYVEFTKITGEKWSPEFGHILDVEEKYMKKINKEIKVFGIVKWLETVNNKSR